MDPVVRILELGDFSLKCCAAGFLSDVTRLITARSRFHPAILDSLDERGVAIVSSTFLNQRQIREPGIPPRVKDDRRI